MTGDERVRLALNVFRGGCRTDNAPPHWGELEPWMRDAMRTTYLQGKLDGSTHYKAPTPPFTRNENSGET